MDVDQINVRGSKDRISPKSKGLDARGMFQKVTEIVNPGTDAEVRMEKDGTYKVLAVRKTAV